MTNANRPALPTSKSVPGDKLPQPVLENPSQAPDKPVAKRNAGYRKKPKKKNPGVKGMAKNALLNGVDGAKGEIANMLADTTQQVLSNLAQSAVQKGVGMVMNGNLLNGAKGLTGIGANPEAASNPGETVWPEYVDKIATGEYGVVTVIGTRDSGKTTVAVALAETRQRSLKSNIYFINYPADMAPDHIIPVHGDRLGELIEKVEFGATVIIDDASMLVNSKRHMTDSGIAFEGLINTIAHRGVLLIITVQDTSDMNKAGLRADMYLIKPPERMFLQTERPRMKIIQTIAAQAFDMIPKEQWIENVYAWIDEDRHGMVKVERPEWLDREHVKYRRLSGGDAALMGQDNMEMENSGGVNNTKGHQKEAAVTPYGNVFDDDGMPSLL